MAVRKHYEALHVACGDVQRVTFDDTECERLLVSAHNRLAELSTLQGLISGRERSVFVAALKELEYGVLAVSIGLYRQAFSAIRLFLDLAVATVFFSSNELDLRHWLNDGENIQWSVLTDDKTGVFSTRYVSAFFPELVGRSQQFKVMASKLHVECSQFVHGNAATHEALPSTLAFQKDLVLDWRDKLETAFIIVLFLFAARYTKDLQPEQLGIVSNLMIEELGHIETIKTAYNG